MPWRQAIDLAAFEPETIELLTGAVDDALAEIGGRGQVLDPEACRLTLARRMAELARDGERDRQRLIAEAALLFKP